MHLLTPPHPNPSPAYFGVSTQQGKQQLNLCTHCWHLLTSHSCCSDLCSQSLPHEVKTWGLVVAHSFAHSCLLCLGLQTSLSLLVPDSLTLTDLWRNPSAVMSWYRDNRLHWAPSWCGNCNCSIPLSTPSLIKWWRQKCLDLPFSKELRWLVEENPKAVRTPSIQDLIIRKYWRHSYTGDRVDNALSTESLMRQLQAAVTISKRAKGGWNPWEGTANLHRITQDRNHNTERTIKRPLPMKSLSKVNVNARVLQFQTSITSSPLISSLFSFLFFA